MKDILKKLLLSISLILLLAVSPAFGQAETINNIKDAIKIGSAKEISKHFNHAIDVTIEGEIHDYSKTQAEYVLKEFFQKYPPSAFVIVHQGASKAGMPYAIGQYTSNEDVFRVWLRIKKSNDAFLIHEISFIKE